MKSKRIILTISIIFGFISFIILLFTCNGSKINNISISVFSGCIVSLATFVSEYIILKESLNSAYYFLFNEFYSYMVQYKSFIENYIKNNTQVTEKMLQYYSNNVDMLYYKISSLDNDVYRKNKKFVELMDTIYKIRNSIINNSKNIDLLIIEKRIENIKEYGSDRIIYTNDLKEEFDTLLYKAKEQINVFEKIIPSVFDSKQIQKFNENKEQINKFIKEFKYERKIT